VAREVRLGVERDHDAEGVVAGPAVLLLVAEPLLVGRRERPPRRAARARDALALGDRLVRRLRGLGEREERQVRRVPVRRRRVLGLLARDIGLEPVRQHARALLWYVPAAVASFAIGHFANSLGWWYAIGPDAPKVSKRRIFAAWSSGDVVNWMTPGAVGGEIL